MLGNYSIGVPSYPIQGMTLQTGVPIVAQQPTIVSPAPSAVGNAKSNTSDLLEFSEMIADTKVGMSKIDMKLDEVLKKVDSIRDSPSNAVAPLAKPETTSVIDPNIVLSSINKVVEESRALKQELLDRDTRIESLNHKVRQLIESNQRYVEQSQHMMERRSDSLHSLSSANNSQIIRLQEENTSLKAKAEEAKRKLESRNLEFGETENDVSEMKKRNELLTQKMNIARTKFREKEGDIEELKNEIERLQRESGKQKATHHSSQREVNDLKETIEEFRESLRIEKQSKKKVQNNLNRVEEELGEVKAEKDVIASSIEERRKKQQNEKNKLAREMGELKRNHEEELSSLKIQLQQSAGPSQVEIAKIEANWKRKMQVEIAKNASTFEEKIEELEGNEERLKSHVQRLEKKMTNLSIENSQLKNENSRILEELDEFEGIKIRESNSQGLIEEQNSTIEELTLSENELKSSVKVFEESEKALMDEIQILGEKNRELESRGDSDKEEWRNQVKHVMNRVYASIQVEFPPENSFTGGQVQELVKAAIKVETMRVLNPDLESTASASPSEDSAEELDPDNSHLKQRVSPSPTYLTTEILTGSNEQYPRQDSPMYSSPSQRTPSPTIHSHTLLTESPKAQSPTYLIESPVHESPNPYTQPQLSSSPVPQIESVSESPTLQTESPIHNSPTPHTQSPKAISPILATESPLQYVQPPNAISPILPTPNSPPLQMESPRDQSPSMQILVTSHSPQISIHDSPTLLTESPTPNSPTIEKIIDSPTLETQSPSNQSPIEPSYVSQSETDLPTETAQSLGMQLPNKYISIEDEDGVDNQPNSLIRGDSGIGNTVVPVSQDTSIESPRPPSTTSSQSPTFDTPSQSPINSPTQPQNSTFDLSPSTSPIPFQSHTPPSPPSPPPMPPHTSPTTNTISIQPDISDAIKEYNMPATSTLSSPPSSPIHSAPPPENVNRYSSFPSHSSTPPPLELSTHEGSEVPTTGNFSPDLLEKHFSDRDNTYGEDELFNEHLPSEVTSDVEPTSNKQETIEKTGTKTTNPLLDNSSDSESDIFSSHKKKPGKLDEDENSASTIRPTPPKDPLFGDSDDEELDWLSK